MTKYPTLQYFFLPYFPDPQKPSGLKDLLHYILVFGVILVFWPQAMSFFQKQTFGFVLELTALTTFYVFIIADKLAHEYVLGER